jgi:hypothetical protein
VNEARAPRDYIQILEPDLNSLPSVTSLTNSPKT